MAERTLLLVDDEPNILRSLVRLLRRDGYRILTAGSGSEGLEVLEKERVGVIISDQRMPEMTGTEFLSRVKERHPETVRLVLSGYTDLDSVTDAINRGAIYKFLTKPWEDDLLRKNITEAFEHYELRAENRRLTEELRTANEKLSTRVAAQDRELGIHHRVLELSREVLEHLPVGVVGVDGEGVIALANNQAHQLLGLASGTLLGSAAEVVLPEGLLLLCRRIANGEESATTRLPLAVGTAMVYCTPLALGEEARGKVMVMVPTGED